MKNKNTNEVKENIFILINYSLMKPKSTDGLPFNRCSRWVINPGETVEERMIVAPPGSSTNTQGRAYNKCQQG